MRKSKSLDCGILLHFLVPAAGTPIWGPGVQARLWGCAMNGGALSHFLLKVCDGFNSPTDPKGCFSRAKAFPPLFSLIVIQLGK